MEMKIVIMVLKLKIEYLKNEYTFKS